jgi:hypothetical protein
MKLTLPNFSTKTRESSSLVAMPTQSEGVKPHTDLNRLSKDTFQHSGAFTGTRILPESVNHLTLQEARERQAIVDKLEAQQRQVQKAYTQMLQFALYLRDNTHTESQTLHSRVQSLMTEFGSQLNPRQKSAVEAAMPSHLKLQVESNKK